jgi:hypothetical protein
MLPRSHSLSSSVTYLSAFLCPSLRSITCRRPSCSHPPVGPQPPPSRSEEGAEGEGLSAAATAAPGIQGAAIEGATVVLETEARTFVEDGDDSHPAARSHSAPSLLLWSPDFFEAVHSGYSGTDATAGPPLSLVAGPKGAQLVVS